ncbi:MAG: (Fe-S)-binding protein [Candidatus Omnitrophica bacterium]|nr:(Fe-S)-binding protein [Candidatus Omnitrophota bacterium]
MKMKDCGGCGFRTCAEFYEQLKENPTLIKNCIYAQGSGEKIKQETVGNNPAAWKDSLGREFDFVLDHFPEEPGPREIIIPHNPTLTREMDLKAGEIIIGRPLGVSCGCPVTHSGIIMDVDKKTGVMVWCVTGPLTPRQKSFKDLGYYVALAYEGLIQESRCEVKIGIRYFFQPRRCMLQWRHSGLVNYLNRTPGGLQARLEGLWIG